MATDLKREKIDINSNIDMDRLLGLCRLSLSEGERVRICRELQRTADYTYPKVQGADVALPFSSEKDRANTLSHMREDIPAPPDGDAAGCAVYKNGSFICVPKVIKEDAK